MKSPADSQVLITWWYETECQRSNKPLVMSELTNDQRSNWRGPIWPQAEVRIDQSQKVRVDQGPHCHRSELTTEKIRIDQGPNFP